MARDTFPNTPQVRDRRSSAWSVGAAAVSAVALVALIIEVMVGSWVAGWDERIITAMVAGRTVIGSHVFWVFSLLGNTTSLGVAAAALVVVRLMWGKRGSAIFAAVTMASASGLSHGLKELLARSRPPASQALIALPESQSLPSGHALMTAVLVGLALCVAGRVWPRSVRMALGAILSAVAACVGFSRVYLGVHWASDVVAGWCLAVIWLALAFTLFRVWRRSRYAVPDTQAWGGIRSRGLIAALLTLVWAAVVVVEALIDPLVV